jgi:hypothetical protein
MCVLIVSFQKLNCFFANSSGLLYLLNLMKNPFLCFCVNLASLSGKHFKPMSSIIEECSSNQSLNSFKSEKKTLRLKF